MADDNPSDQLVIKASVAEESPGNGYDDECRRIKPSDPCAIIIYGASGDLTSRKLIPAIYKLYINSYMPGSFFIVGCARKKLDNKSFREKIKASLNKEGLVDQVKWEAFAANLYYQSIEYDEAAGFEVLKRVLDDLDKKYRTGGNRLFYLAIPPFLYETVVNMTGQSGLGAAKAESGGWSRIVVEKPFGSDLKSSVALNNILQQSFKEHQIYRIDHYLAKETVQNILVFRFANSIFEPLWNRQFIEYIDIRATETLGVEHRAGYYEKAGVLRDMFQNHMMQLLTLTAMEPPAHFQPESVRDEKAKLIQSIRPFNSETRKQNIVLGQYGAGMIDGKRVPAYREEAAVNPRSFTPTFVIMKLFIDNWRWQGVPFYMLTGKRLAEKLTRIVIQFKDVPHAIFRNVFSKGIIANRLIFSIQPNEKISLTFQAKNPGSTICARSINMQFSYDDYQEQALEAYEKVLIDCLNGDQMLFLRQDSEELCWSLLTPLIEDCEKCADQGELLKFYEAGTCGPKLIETPAKC